MTNRSRSDPLDAELARRLTPILAERGFKPLRRSRWQLLPLQIRVVRKAGINDPYTGRQFLLEFEVSHTSKFERKFTGRARLDGLLDGSQRARLLHARNEMAGRLPQPPQDFVDGISPQFQQAYLDEFRPAEDLRFETWMHYRTADDAAYWAEFLAEVMPPVVDRARSLDPRELVMGLHLY